MFNKMRERRLTDGLNALTIMMLISLWVIPVGAADDLNFVTKVESSSGYVCAVTMVDVFKKKLNADISVQVLPTVPEDFLALKSGRGDLFVTGTSEWVDAFEGERTMKKAGRVDLRALATGGVGGAGIIVTNRSGITSGEQLKGHKIYANFPKVPLLLAKTKGVIRAYGLDPDKDVTLLNWNSVPEVNDGIREGKAVGVYYLVGGAKCAQLDAMIPGGCRLLPLPQDKKILSKYMWPIDPSTALGTVQPQPTVPEPTPGWIMTYTLGSRPGISNDIAYKLTKTLWENLDEMAKGYKILGTWKIENGLDPFLIPFHPGAIKYYKEKGLWTAELDRKQAELLKK
jgi:TRAP transporter TAXI family solute receptor